MRQKDAEAGSLQSALWGPMGEEDRGQEGAARSSWIKLGPEMNVGNYISMKK